MEDWIIGDDRQDFFDWLSRHRPLTAVVSSRVGISFDVHRRLAKQLIASERETRRADATWVSVAGTAIDAWLRHAADLFQNELIRLRVECSERSDGFSALSVRPPDGQTVDPDELLFVIADRVDLLRVRSGGKIERLAIERAERDSGSVHLAMDPGLTKPRVIRRLLDAGVVGRYRCDEKTSGTQTLAPMARCDAPRWRADGDDWVTHCTREITGPWPGQSWRRYRDELFLKDDASPRDACQSLCRIVRSACLVGGSVASRSDEPVVCFSAVPLGELMDRRTYRPHLKRWDYEPFGISIRADAAGRLGMRPVVYGDRSLIESASPDERFRYVSAGRKIDWTAEREWRHRGNLDLSTLRREEVKIFVPDEAAAARVEAVNSCQWPVVTVNSRG